MANKQEKPIMPRPGASSVTPEQARQERRRRRSIRHSKGAMKKRKKGK